MTDKTRHLSPKVEALLEMFPAVAILGARQAGKTTLSKQLRPNWQYYDLERPTDYNRIQFDPELFFSTQDGGVILDEAQRLPEIFNVLRGVIDEDRDNKGRFLITGSSSPELHKHISESLAGRIAVVELGTLKATEYFAKPNSDFNHIFRQPLSKECVESISSTGLTIQQMRDVWFRGGYPEPTLSSNEAYYQQWIEHYINTHIHRDISNLFPKLNKVAYQRFISMLSRLSGTILNKSEVARALEVGERSIREYTGIASGTYLWRELASYERNVKKSVVKMPKGYMRDTGLLHALLAFSSPEQLYNHPIVGHSFEGFVIEEIIKGIEATMATQWSAYYYKTRAGSEIDLILEGSFGILPIEIKYGVTATPKQIRTISTFVEEHALPFGLLINQSKEACWLNKHIYQLPVNYL